MTKTISGKCEFETETAKVFFQTNLNGDTITIAGVYLDNNNAASLAWLLNKEDTLKIKIKEAGE